MHPLDHDNGINRIYARKNRRCSGMGLGIIILDDDYPGFPGDVRNASAYPFPIQFEVAQGVDIQKLVRDPDKTPCFAPICRAARNLQRMGCRAIAAECGYFAFFQRAISAVVDIPVFMSSLLQGAWARQLIAPEKVVGLLVAAREFLSDAHLGAVGIDPDQGYVVAGAMDDHGCPEFDHLWSRDNRTDPPSAVYRTAEHDFVQAGVRFFKRHPEMGAMVLECTGFPPFARALQRCIDIPVFSWGTLLDYAYSVVVHRDYYGHV